MSREMFKKLILVLLLTSGFGLLPILHAQEPTQTPTATPQPLTVTQLEPMRITSGQANTVNIYGTNFTGSTLVRMVGLGMLDTAVSGSTALTVVIPDTIGPGEYQLEVVDPVHGTALVPQTLAVSLAPTATATQRPPMELTSFEPMMVMNDTSQMISIYGHNFTESTTVRLVGYGVLAMQVVNSDVMTATMPGGVPAGMYTIEVSDPQGGTLYFQQALMVQAPPAPTAPPTETPFPTSTPEPPTPVPGQPHLLARNFNVRPATIIPGGSVVLFFEVVNQGSRPAQGISIAVDSGGSFFPAQGSASVSLPDLPVGGRLDVTLNVIAADDLPEGPTTIPLVMTYRDFSGENYTSNATLSVNIAPIAEAPQVVLSEYEISPAPASQGEAVTIRAVLINTGNETAEQVLLRLTGSDTPLLPGARGDSFPMGNLRPGGSREVTFTMIVNTEAEAGPQIQPVTINYRQQDEAIEYTTNVTVDIAAATTTEPLLLLESYTIGREIVAPGETFTLNLEIRNVSAAQASSVLVIYGVADTTVPSDDGSGGDSGTGSTTPPGNTFAPIGTGGTIFVGNLENTAAPLALSQDFIVSGTAKSGIYTLPITVQYQLPDGETKRTVLRASIVVVAPPSLQISLESPIPPQVNAGDFVPVAVKLMNIGDQTVRLLRASVTAENAQVMEGAETQLAALLKEKDTTINAAVSPEIEGAVTITVVIYYLDDLNQERSIARVYSTEALPPPPEPEFEPFTPEPPPVDVAEEAEEDEGFDVGRFLLGLMGLGS